MTDVATSTLPIPLVDFYHRRGNLPEPDTGDAGPQFRALNRVCGASPCTDSPTASSLIGFVCCEGFETEGEIGGCTSCGSLWGPRQSWRESMTRLTTTPYAAQGGYEKEHSRLFRVSLDADDFVKHVACVLPALRTETESDRTAERLKSAALTVFIGKAFKEWLRLAAANELSLPVLQEEDGPPKKPGNETYGWKSFVELARTTPPFPVSLPTGASKTVRVPTVERRTEYPPEEPEWDEVAYQVSLAVEKFYESGDANRHSSE